MARSKTMAKEKPKPKSKGVIAISHTIARKVEAAAAAKKR
jgi:hypothetical protein